MKIASAFAMSEKQRRLLLDAVPGSQLVDRQCASGGEVLELVRGGCDVLLTFMVPDELLQATPQLKWIQLISAGADHMMKGPAGNGVVRLTTTSGVHAASLAEFAIAMMLMHVHRLHTTSRAQYRHQWLPAPEFMKTADTLRGKTLGIIGYGSIGRELARIAQALGMDVLALKRDPTVLRDSGWMPSGIVGDPEGRIPRRVFAPEDRAGLLRESDFVVLLLPLTAATRHFIGAPELAVMKPNALLVNVGRGPLVDEPALISALQDKRIAGAGLDVFEREPLPTESPLWDLEEVIMTPHMAGPFRGYLDLACELFAQNLRRFAVGEPMLNEIDWQLGY
ncbi:MAG TPA: D-2-hydroxyacid dehydrogenase [Candidatus Binataceae bacterium]|nr:D-2-hydroxyacid dehydrogenase [Candidatus Binataceae bacterium]